MGYPQPPPGDGSWYQGPPAPGYYQQPMYPPPRQTNTMAIVALVSSLVMAPLGIVFGHIALSQIRRSGEDGKGLAIAGLVIGYVSTALFILLIVFWLVMITFVWTHMDLPPSTTTRGTYSMSAGVISR